MWRREPMPTVCFYLLHYGQANDPGFRKDRGDETMMPGCTIACERS